MRILHLSDSALPDWRIEKTAISASNRGHEVLFAGEKPINYSRTTFSKIYELKWTPRARRGIPIYWQSVKKQIARIINEAKPDIVHANNIFSAKMISEFGLPFVYDDHEYWSVYVKRQAESQYLKNNNSRKISGGLPRRIARKLARSILNRSFISLGTKWEKEIVSTAPTITVSDKIAEELEVISGNRGRVFVVPNFPMRNEVSGMDKPRLHEELSSVYAGLEAQDKIKLAHRDNDGLTDTFINGSIGSLTVIGAEGKSSPKVKYTGLLPRQLMYKEMSNHSVGLVPWKKHWSHKYVSPNKAYEYAHAGLFVMCTSSFETVSTILKDNCITFEDYEDMTSKLEFFRNLEELYNKRRKLFEFAQNSLVWELYEKNIFSAYSKC